MANPLCTLSFPPLTLSQFPGLCLLTGYLLPWDIWDEKLLHVIKTFRRSYVTIRLNDNTIIKIGKRTTLKIEKYLFDKKHKKKSVANFKIENGSFRVKTGKIGDNAPRNFKIKTKFSTIGLRGWKKYF